MPNCAKPELLAQADRAALAERAEAEVRLAPPSWQKPVLTVHGDVRELTMGPSPNSGESGNPLTFRT